MILHAFLLTLMLQGAPPARPPVANANISGVAVIDSSGEPVANVRVTLARVDASLGPFAQLISGGRAQSEQSVSGDVLRILIGQLNAELAGGTATPDIVARAAAFKALLVEDIDNLIVSPTGDVAISYKSLPPIMTDERGRFAFPDVPTGAYKLIFSGSGYAKQDYGQRAPGSGGIPIVVASGQPRTDLVMRMAAVASISGRIRDAAGRAAAGVPVQLFRFSYDALGQKKVQRLATAHSDDRGEYRMFYLSPGRYFLSAGNAPGEGMSTGAGGLLGLSLGNGYSTTNRIDRIYALSYYPGVADVNSAQPLDLPSGADLRNIDMVVTAQHLYRVSGRLVNSGTNQAPQTFSLVLRALSSDPRAGSIGDGGAGANGSFELRGVPPGTYSLTATVQDRNGNSGLSANAVTSVNVVDADIDGIALTFENPSVIPGRVRVEMNPGSPSPSLGLMHVELRTPGEGLNKFYRETPRFQAGDSDTSFRIENVLPGTYGVFLSGLPAGFYVKEVRFGDVDVFNEPLRFDGRNPGTIEVLLNSRVGSLQGVVTDGSTQPVPGAQVVLIPNANRQRIELFRPVTTDSSGRFSIPAVAPGEYTLAAWEALEPFAFFDPDVIRRAEGRGKIVNVAEMSSQTVNVTAIP